MGFSVLKYFKFICIGLKYFITFVETKQIDMDREHNSFKVTFMRRNRALFELLNDDEIEAIISDAYAFYKYSPDWVSVSKWFEEAYGGWIIIYLASYCVSDDVKQCLINSANK